MTKSTFFKVGFKREGTDNEAIVEIRGSLEWIEALLPGIGISIASAIKDFGLAYHSFENYFLELEGAMASLRMGDDYAGQIVTVTRTTDEPPDSKV